MKKILESLHTLRGIISESYLDELLDHEAIDKGKGKEFLVTTGVINKTKVSALWEHSVILSDVPHLFRDVADQWKADGILISHVLDVRELDFDLPASTLIWLHFEKYDPEIIRSVYNKFDKIHGVAFIQSYYLQRVVQNRWGIFASTWNTLSFLPY